MITRTIVAAFLLATLAGSFHLAETSHVLAAKKCPDRKNAAECRKSNFCKWKSSANKCVKK